MKIGTRLLWLPFLVPWAAAAGSQDIPLRRVPTYELHIQLPGVAVIRDSATWAELWRRYEERAYGDSGVVHAAVPAIDFRKEMLVAVALGQSSGCSNSAHHIGQLVERPDSIVVVIGSPGDYGPVVTCAMVIEPVDVVRLGRSAKPVAFHPYQPGMPTAPPATWWNRPSVAELDRMDELERRVFTAVLADDPATPLSTLVAIAQRMGADGWGVAQSLLRRPDARTNVEILMALARWTPSYDAIGRDVRNELFMRHGLELAGESATPSDVLRMLIERLREQWTPHHEAVARLLLQNPTVRGNERLLGRFIYLTMQRPEMSIDACKLYVARWPSWEATAPDDGTAMNRACIEILRPPPPPPRPRH